LAGSYFSGAGIELPIPLDLAPVLMLDIAIEVGIVGISGDCMKGLVLGGMEV
jgi:hypothetical protein